jgi:uncharacterized cupin superfamily protein
MKIISQNQAVHIDKAEGSAVEFYIFPEYEVHYNEIKPGTVQLWHHHSRISETLFVVSGEIEAHWIDENGQKTMKVVTAGDVVEVENSPHTFINTSQGVVKFVVFRFVPTGEDKREMIKNDKVLDDVK